jgi:hypothetical protein
VKKILTLVLASSFFAITAPAFEDEPENYMIGTDEYTAPIQDESSNADSLRKYNCPRGTDRVPTYRWNYRHHRWEFAGYRCRRSHDNGRPGREHDGGPH